MKKSPALARLFLSVSAVSPPEEGKSKQEGEQKRPEKEWGPAETEKWSNSFILPIGISSVFSARETATGETATGETATGIATAWETRPEMPGPGRTEPGVAHPREEKRWTPKRRPAERWSAESVGSVILCKRSYICKVIIHLITSQKHWYALYYVNHIYKVT